MAKTPLMEQYRKVKDQYRDCLLFTAWAISMNFFMMMQ